MIVSRVGITPVGSSKYRINRLRFHLLAYSIARQAQLQGKEGIFIIRCDDSDKERANRSYFDGYMEVLRELGVHANYDPYTGDLEGNSLYQSERIEIYQKQLQNLKDADLILRDSSGALFFDVEKFSQKYPQLISDNKIKVLDGVRGEMKIDIRSQDKEYDNPILKPFPIVRQDGTFLFNFTSPVDDGVLGVTHVVRDRDKLDLLPKQEMVRISLGFNAPIYVHAPLLVNDEGKRFIKHEYYGDSSYQDFIERGILPKGLVSYLLSGFCGGSERFYKSIDEFAISLNLSKITTKNIRFTEEVLEQHNKKALLDSTKAEYLEGLRKFLAWKSPELLEQTNNTLLVDILYKGKRRFADAETIIRDLNYRGFENVEPDTQSRIRAILSIQMSEQDKQKENPFQAFYIERAKQHAESLGMTYPEYCKSLTLALIGKKSIVNLSDAVRYYEGNNTIQSRLESAFERMRRI